MALDPIGPTLGEAYGIQSQPPKPKAGEASLPTGKVRYIEFDRSTIRKGERWTCRVLFCDYSYRQEGGTTTSW